MNLGALGRGVSAGALGSLRGENLAEAEGYRRSERAKDREYKNAYLASKKKTDDPFEDVRKRAGMTAQMLIKMRLDPNMRAFFLSPQGQPLAKQLEQAAQKWTDIHLKRADPTEADTFELSGGPIIGEELTGPPPGAPPGAAAGGEAPPAPGPFTVPLPGDRTATPPELPAVAPGPPASPGGTNPAMDDVLRRMVGISPVFKGLAPPGPDTAIPTPGGGPSAVPPPQTALQRYDEIRSNPPVVQPIPGEKPEKTEARRQALMREWQALVKEAREAVTLEDEAAIKGSERTIKGATAAQIRPALNIRRGQGLAGIEASRQTAATQKALRPVNVQKGKEEIKTKQQARKTERERVRLEERRTASTEKQAKTAEGRLRLAKDQFEEAKRRVAFTLKQKDLSKADTDDRGIMNDSLKILGAFRRDVIGDVPSYSEAEREKARQRYEAALARREARRRSGSSGSSTETTVSFKGRPEQAKGLLKTKPTTRGKRIPKSDLLAIARKRKYDAPTTREFLKFSGY